MSGVEYGDRPAKCLMSERGGRRPAAVDPRAAALARYLRAAAATFSMSADATNTASTADAGMALLDAAEVAEAMQGDDHRMTLLSEAGLFESMPHGEAAVVDRPEIRRAVQRTLLSAPQNGRAIIAKLVSTVTAAHEPPSGDEGP
jgi:hypothetical protein